MSFGNIIGSNIANIALVIGICAAIKPLSISESVIKREIPMMILAACITFILGTDFFLNGSANIFDRQDGLIMLLILGVFLFYTTGDVIAGRKEETRNSSKREKPIIKTIIYNFTIFLFGLLLLIAGGKFAVDGGVEVAYALNIPKVIIGLTVIAVGTSLPELVTSIIATGKGHTDIAIGNVVGSNIINLLFIAGLTSSIKPIPVPAGGVADLMMMVFLSALLLPLSITDRRQIVRREGVFLIGIYFAYSIWRIF